MYRRRGRVPAKHTHKHASLIRLPIDFIIVSYIHPDPTHGSGGGGEGGGEGGGGEGGGAKQNGLGFNGCGRGHRG